MANIPRWGSRIEPENDGTGKMTFPWKRAVFSGFMLIFQGVLDVSFPTFLIHTVLLTSSKLIWRTSARSVSAIKAVLLQNSLNTACKCVRNHSFRSCMIHFLLSNHDYQQNNNLSFQPSTMKNWNKGSSTSKIL